jgi:hypothetical protein
VADRNLTYLPVRGGTHCGLPPDRGRETTSRGVAEPGDLDALEGVDDRDQRQADEPDATDVELEVGMSGTVGQ